MILGRKESFKYPEISNVDIDKQGEIKEKLRNVYDTRYKKLHEIAVTLTDWISG